MKMKRFRSFFGLSFVMPLLPITVQWLLEQTAFLDMLTLLAFCANF